jgi:hypothetical protein
MSHWESQSLPPFSTYDEIVGTVRNVSPCQGLFMPSVLRQLQQQLFGLKRKISRDDVQLLEKEKGTHLADILQTAASAAADKLPPLCRVLEELASTTELADRERVISALRDKQAPFHVIAKESTGSLISFLCSCGVSTGDAQEIALAIYAKHRRSTKRAQKGLSTLNNAKEALEHKDSVVDLGNCELDAAQLEKTVPLICNDEQLSSLDLRGNNIHLAGSKLIAQIIKSSSRLVRIDVSGNCLLAEGLRALFGAVKDNKTLKHLSAANCHGGQATVTYAKEMLQGHPSIQSLNLSGNDVTVFTDFPHIPELCAVSLSCNFLQRGSLDGLSKLLSSHPLLRKLDVSYNEFDVQTWEPLRASLTNHASLQTLLLNGNKCDRAALNVLEEVFVQNKRIVATDLPQLAEKCKANMDAVSQRITALLASPSASSWSTEDVDVILLYSTSAPSTLRNLRGVDGASLAGKRISVQINDEDWDALVKFPW